MNVIQDALRVVRTPINKEGNKFIAIAGGVSLVCFFINGYLGIFTSLIALWVMYFFRDPIRVTPQKEGLIISPADGIIQKIEAVVPPEDLGMEAKPLTRISIFMNVFNVHVNRIPIAGEIKALHYYKGIFASTLDKESDKNEKQAIRIDALGRSFAVVQIAGLIARRIVCDLKKDQQVKTGERLGMIRFGSRLDVYIPQDINPLVVVGQIAIAGETILADVNGTAEQPEGIAS